MRRRVKKTNRIIKNFFLVYKVQEERYIWALHIHTQMDGAEHVRIKLNQKQFIQSKLMCANDYTTMTICICLYVQKRCVSVDTHTLAYKSYHVNRNFLGLRVCIWTQRIRIFLFERVCVIERSERILVRIDYFDRRQHGNQPTNNRRQTRLFHTTENVQHFNLRSLL